MSDHQTVADIVKLMSEDAEPQPFQASVASEYQDA